MSARFSELKLVSENSISEYLAAMQITLQRNRAAETTEEGREGCRVCENMKAEAAG